MKQQMLSKVLLSTVVVMGSIAGSSLVMDDNAHAEQKVIISETESKNESTLHLSFEKGIKGTVDKNGKLTLSDGKTSKVMPTNAKDKKVTMLFWFIKG